MKTTLILPDATFYVAYTEPLNWFVRLCHYTLLSWLSTNGTMVVEKYKEVAMFIPFDELKKSTNILHVAELLELSLKKEGDVFRAECPKCQGGKRTLVISPDKQAFFCFSTNQGGDLISLVQHVRDISIKEAAHYIHASLTVPPKGATPASNQEVPDHPFSKIAKGLQYDHELLAILGLDKEQAEALGIGFKRAGVMRGKVVIPLRDQNGTVVRCLGLPTDVFAEAELGKEFDLTKV